MKENEIIEVGLDLDGSLFVRPKAEDFSYIYRAAMGVRWDTDRGRLFFPKSSEWSYAKCFSQILSAAEDEYRVRLVLSPQTTWFVSDGIRSEIESRTQKPA